MIRSVLLAPVMIILLPLKALSQVPRMPFSTVFAIGIGAARAFAATRRLINQKATPTQLPPGLQRPTIRLQNSLMNWRSHLAQAIEDANEAEATAESELRNDHLRRSGRLSD